MRVKEEVQKEEEINESSLTDLPLVDEQADAAKGGGGLEKQMHIESFSFGLTQGGGGSN